MPPECSLVGRHPNGERRGPSNNLRRIHYNGYSPIRWLLTDSANLWRIHCKGYSPVRLLFPLCKFCLAFTQDIRNPDILAQILVNKTSGSDRTHVASGNVNLRRPSQVVPKLPCSHLWSARLQPTLICDFRAVPAQCRPCAALCGTLIWEPPVPGLGSTRLWSGKHPSVVRKPPVAGLGSTLCRPFLVVPATPCSHLWSARLQLTLILARG